MSIELWALLAGHRDAAVTAMIQSDSFEAVALHPEHQVPPLVALIAHEATHGCGLGMFPMRCAAVDASCQSRQKVKVLALARAMVEAGACPGQTAPDASAFSVVARQRAQAHDQHGELVFSDAGVPETRAFEEVIPCAGHSAVSLATAMRLQLNQADGTRSSRTQPNDECYLDQPEIESVWLESLHILDALLHYFATVALHAPAPERHVRVAEGVVAHWEAFLADTQSHDVTLRCAGGEAVGAHARMLALASPALAALLAAPLGPEEGGRARAVALPDCPRAAARLFLELLYTGSSTADADADATLLAALRLAHRWGVQSLVDLLERACTPASMRELKRASFEDIAEAAQVLELPALRRACKLFAAGDANISFLLQGRQLRPAVLKLLAPPWPAATTSTTANGGAPAKKRRTF